MEIAIPATALNAKYVMQQPLKWLRPKRSCTFFKEYLYQKKYRDGHKAMKRNYEEKKYCKQITFRMSESQFKELHIKSTNTPIVITSFNKAIRNLFYTEYFVYMDKQMLINEYKRDNDFQIREIAINFMMKLFLTEVEIKLQTLLRNYRRYRENPDWTMEENLEHISEDDITD